MRVTLIRHAEAGDDARRDEERALTVRGRDEARRLGRLCLLAFCHGSSRPQSSGAHRQHG